MAQKLREWTYGQAAVHRVFTPMLRPKLPRRGDDRVSGTDAERDDDIYHNGTSGFGGNAARGEMADLSRVLINAQVAACGQAPSEDRTCPLRQKRRHAFVSTAR